MTPEQLRAFAHRDWEALAASKRTFWVEQFQAYGAEPAWHASNALLADMRATRPDYPSAADRGQDHAHHARLAEQLSRAAHAFTNRTAAR